MFNKMREMNGCNLSDGELANELVSCLPCDQEGALFWI